MIKSDGDYRVLIPKNTESDAWNASRLGRAVMWQWMRKYADFSIDDLDEDDDNWYVQLNFLGT